MAEAIKDGVGSGKLAKVTEQNRLSVYSKAAPIQHVVSEQDEKAFQVIGTATLASGTVVSLHVTNNDPDRQMVVTYIRHQIIDPSGGTALPNASNYFRVALNRSYTSGGAAATPVNVFANSGISSNITAYQTAPTLGGTAGEIDRWYTKAEADMNTFNKEGAIVIPSNGTIELAYVGDQTSGTIYSRLSFFMEAE